MWATPRSRDTVEGIPSTTRWVPTKRRKLAAPSLLWFFIVYISIRTHRYIPTQCARPRRLRQPKLAGTPASPEAGENTLDVFKSHLSLSAEISQQFIPTRV